MLKTLSRVTVTIVLLACVLLAAGAAWYIGRTRQFLVPPPDPAGQGSIVQYIGSTGEYTGAPLPDLRGAFSWEAIASPPKSARAWTRWWWPGGAVEADVLEEQLAVLDEAGFGGVEVQPILGGVTAVMDNAALMARVYSFDTPSYYATLNAAIDTAASRDMQVDLTHFSGWPPGGPEVNLQDSNTLLAYAQTQISGGVQVEVELPRPAPGMSEYLFTAIEFSGVDFTNFPAEHASLLSVVAARRSGGERSASPLVLDDTVELAADSLQVLTDKVRDGVLHWDAPPGDWEIVASYLLPSGEVPMVAAQKPQGFVVDHLRRPQVIGHYEYAFGARTGLPDKYGRGLRGFFNDSLEFRLKRMAVEDILGEFRARRGYDLEPYLPAVHVEGADNVYFREILGLHAAPEFAVTGQDARIRHDYQRTLSDLIIERFVETSADWAEARGLVSRAQSYGMDLDILRALGANTIPETEQLWAGGSDVGLKFASSAAALYGRPLVSAESFVWINRDYMPTARRIKAAADKLFLAGINHIIYHGTPYPWDAGGAFGEEGWAPFSGPENPAHFSANVSPGNTALWPDVPALNRYIARSQYLLRQGAPEIDVLIYYPFLGFHGSNPDTPTPETLVGGALPDADPHAVANEAALLTQGKKLMDRVLRTPAHAVDERVAWVEKMQPLLHALDRRGITWGWVNAHALESGRVSAGRLQASGGVYRAILLPDVDHLDASTLQALAKEARAGKPVILAGRQPVGQTGFDPTGRRDEAVRQAVEALLAAGARSTDVDPATLLPLLAAARTGDLAYTASSAIKRHSRLLADGVSVHFFANQSPGDAAVELQTQPGDGAWWFDPLEGVAWPADAGTGRLSLALAGFESRFLVRGVPLPDSVTRGAPGSLAAAGAARRWTPGEWQFRAGDFTADWRELPDWRDVAALRHARGGTYRHTLELQDMLAGARYVLDLGLVQGSAAVTVNGSAVGRASVPPFTLDIGAALVPGENRIEIEVLAPLRNPFVGRGLAGDPQYSHMSGYADQLVAAGLIGPVVVSEVPAAEEGAVEKK